MLKMMMFSVVQIPIYKLNTTVNLQCRPNRCFHIRPVSSWDIFVEIVSDGI